MAREELRMKKLLLILAATVATLFSAALYADDYPSRPITIVNVFGPGSGSDTVSRIIADKLSPVLGQPVIVEDRQPMERWLLSTSIISRQTATRSSWALTRRCPPTHSYTGA